MCLPTSTRQVEHVQALQEAVQSRAEFLRSEGGDPDVPQKPSPAAVAQAAAAKAARAGSSSEAKAAAAKGAAAQCAGVHQCLVG
jgi:protein involved in temperature-dependent protein secretion